MADIRERIEHLPEAIEAAIDARQAEMWTVIPGTIVSYDKDKQTCVIQPAIKSTLRQHDGKLERVRLPELHDVPVKFPQGGGGVLTFPIKKGDEVLVHFASRSIDQWHQSGGEQQQVSARMHDLSDAFADVSVRNQKRKLTNVSDTSVQLRTDDGKSFFDINPTTGAIKHQVEKDGKTTVVSQTHMGVDYTVPAEGTGVTVNGKRIDDTHEHTNVEPGGGTSGPPV